MNLAWNKCEGDKWCPFLTVNLETVSLNWTLPPSAPECASDPTPGP